MAAQPTSGYKGRDPMPDGGSEDEGHSGALRARGAGHPRPEGVSGPSSAPKRPGHFPAFSPSVCAGSTSSRGPTTCAPRSWAYRDDAGQIIAHLGIGPITFLLRDATVTANMMIDWAASPDWRGVGVRLMEEVTKDLPLRFALGGTPAAQRFS